MAVGYPTFPMEPPWLLVIWNLRSHYGKLEAVKSVRRVNVGMFPRMFRGDVCELHHVSIHFWVDSWL